MPKIGIIHQDYLNSPTLTDVERISFEAYIYLPRFWPIDLVDVFGCFPYRPRTMFAQAFELEEYWQDRVTEADVRRWLQEYEQAEILDVWTDKGRKYGFWVGWFKYNRHRPEYARKTPIPPRLIGTDIHHAELRAAESKRRKRGRLSQSRDDRDDAARSCLLSPVFRLLSSSSSTASRGDANSDDGDDARDRIELAIAERKALPAREREESCLTDLTEVAQKITGEPWQGTRPNLRHVRDLLERGLTELEIAGAFGCYVKGMRDPSKISIEKFVEMFSKHHAAYYRLRGDHS